MKITFDSHSEKAELMNALLFAQHKTKEITQMEAVAPERAEQMQTENVQWSRWMHALSSMQGKLEVEFK